MFRALCPDCGEVVELKESTRVGDRVVCVECGVELEVISLYPFDLDYVLEEDWGDEDEDWNEDEESEEADQEDDDEEEDDWDDL